MIIDALHEYQLTNEIVHVRDGVEALDFLHRRGAFAERPSGNPGVVLLDLKMPRMGGVEVLRQIKADPALQMTPVVVMTSSREEQDVVETYKLGVNAYVVKPVKFHEFVEAVRQFGGFWALINLPPPNTAQLLTTKINPPSPNPENPKEPAPGRADSL
jgi:CheY-like chemotaxis protein